MKYYRVNKKNKRKAKQEKIRNRRLVKKYSWLIPRNCWTDKVPDDYDYSYIEWGCATGWDKAFGNIFLEELGDAIKEAGLEHTFRILEIKEKYGQLRMYTNGYTEKINRIIDKYSVLSENICIGCGKPDVSMINDGWYSPWCFDCFKKNWRHREDYIRRSREKRGDSVDPPASEDEIKKAYEECVVDKPEMSESYTIRRYNKDGNEDETIDISETANKIRKRWDKFSGGRDG